MKQFFSHCNAKKLITKCLNTKETTNEKIALQIQWNEDEADFQHS